MHDENDYQAMVWLFTCSAAYSIHDGGGDEAIERQLVQISVQNKNLQRSWQWSKGDHNWGGSRIWWRGVWFGSALKYGMPETWFAVVFFSHNNVLGYLCFETSQDLSKIVTKANTAWWLPITYHQLMYTFRSCLWEISDEGFAPHPIPHWIHPVVLQSP